MAKVTFENLTVEQAKILSEWFEGQGEQDCVCWFEDRGVISPTTNVGRLDEHGVFTGYREILSNGDVIVYVR